jgi:hypothetical protein
VIEVLLQSFEASLKLDSDHLILKKKLDYDAEVVEKATKSLNDKFK